MKRSGNELKRGTWIVYILHCADGSFYTGVTNRLEKRLLEHNRGKASKYTRSRRPVTLLTTSCPMSRGDALRLEIKIKKMPKLKKVACLQAAIEAINVYHEHPSLKKISA